MSNNILQTQIFTLSLKEFLKQASILFFVGGGGITLLFGRYMGAVDFNSFVRVASFQGLIWIILWIGNGVLSNYLDTKISWLDRPEIRFVLGVVSTVVYTIVSLSILMLAWSLLVFGNSLEKSLKVILQLDFFVTALIITAFISMFVNGRAFLKEWRASASEAARLKSENLSARYETLKNQVNPHFLFNSFNVLSTLVYKDQDMAAKFIKQLSNLYRYVLETKDKETVRIEEELKALMSFIFLSKMRFAENVHFDVDLEAIKGDQIAPMTLQMLVENAIKHNVVSKAKPLTVRVFQENNKIIVQNNLQRKNNVTTSAGIGLPNIKARYEYLSDEELSIVETEEYFTVKVPLLKL